MATRNQDIIIIIANVCFIIKDAPMANDVCTCRYASEKQPIWDAFVNLSPQGTVFHTRQFLKYHPAERFIDHSLIFQKKTQPLAIFPAAEIMESAGKALISHPGASYGGFCTVPNISLHDCYELLDSLSVYCTNQNFKKIAFRTPPRIFARESVDQLEFALVKNGFVRCYEELATVFLIRRFAGLLEKDILSAIPQKTRNLINKGIKEGLHFCALNTDGAKELYKILEANLSKFGTRPTHSLEELIQLQELLPDSILAFGVYKDLSLIGGFFVFKITADNLHIFYSCQDYSYSYFSPACFGVYKLICWAAMRNYATLNYGISTEQKGEVINWGLQKFKESFGGTGTIRTGWEKLTG